MCDTYGWSQGVHNKQVYCNFNNRNCPENLTCLDKPLSRNVYSREKCKVFIYMHMHVRVCVCVCVCVFVCVCPYVCVSLPVYACLCVLVYVLCVLVSLCGVCGVCVVCVCAYFYKNLGYKSLTLVSL